MRKSRPRLPSTLKSSPDARRLLEAIYKQEGSWPKVAKRLKLGSAAAAWKMAKGQLHDTDEMKIALRSARRRERLGFAGVRLNNEQTNLATDLLKLAALDADRLLKRLKKLLRDEADLTETEPQS